MDAWCDPRVAAAEQLHEELYGAFYRRAVRTEPSAPLTIDLIRLLGVLRDLKRMHASCELETEMYVRRELAGESEDVALSFGRVETLFNAVVRFQTAEGLSTAERRSRFPKANYVDEEGSTPLLRAVEAADLPLVEALLNFGADPNLPASGRTPLYIACERGRVELVGTLMRAGADAHRLIDQMGATPLYICCHRGHVSCVDELLLFGADANRRLRDGSTVLHVAIKANHAEVVSLLLSAGADPNLHTSKGVAPLLRACATGASATVVRALLGAHADADDHDPQGVTPLHEAAARGDQPVVELLLSANAQVDARDYGGANTALLRAVGAGRFGAAHALLAARADVAMANAGGVTPLRLARSLEARQPPSTGAAAAAAALVELLMDFGAPYDVRTRSGRTPLYLAAQLGDCDEIRWLLARGAAVDRRCDDGATPLQVACQQAHGACDLPCMHVLTTAPPLPPPFPTGRMPAGSRGRRGAPARTWRVSAVPRQGHG